MAAGTMSSSDSSSLLSGEKSLWRGEPAQGVRLRSSDALMIPFSLMWGGFAIFWETTVLMSKAPWFFVLWGIPFVLIGLYMIFGRFIFDSVQRARTTYQVTNRRVLIEYGVFGRKIRSFDLNSLGELGMQEDGNGRGTITFGGSTNAAFSYFGAARIQQNNPSSCFDSIDKARQVYQIIVGARNEARTNQG